MGVTGITARHFVNITDRGKYLKYAFPSLFSTYLNTDY